MYQRIFAFSLILIASVYPIPGEADINWSDLKEGPTVSIADVVDGDTVKIDPPVGGVSEVRLVGIQAPKLPLGRTGFEPWPLGEEAKAALAALVLDKQERFTLADVTRIGMGVSWLMFGPRTMSGPKVECSAAAWLACTRLQITVPRFPPCWPKNRPLV